MKGRENDNKFHEQKDSVCPVCNNSFQHTNPRKVFCSEECHRISINRNQRKNTERICEICDDPFIAQYGPSKTCSPECSLQLKKETKVKNRLANPDLGGNRKRNKKYQRSNSERLSKKRKIRYNSGEKIRLQNDLIDIVCDNCGGPGQMRRIGHERTDKHYCSDKCMYKSLGKSKRLGLDGFLNRAKEVHSDKYSYELVANYETNSQKIAIICKDHGVFHQNISNHLHGQGCPKCARELNLYSRSDWVKKYNSENVHFYVIRAFNDEENFIKIGISGRSLSDRFKSKQAMPYNYEVLKEIHGDAGYIWDLEKDLLSRLIRFRYIPLLKFGGSRECFTCDSIQLIDSALYTSNDLKKSKMII